RDAPRAPRAERPLRADVSAAAPRGGARGRRGAGGAQQAGARAGWRRAVRGGAAHGAPWRGRPPVAHGGGGGHGATGFFQEDEILGKAYDARLTRRLVGYLGPCKPETILSPVPPRRLS